jgi:uncharacterized membrane protein
VLGFKQPDFHGEIIAELERLLENGTVRVIDALAVHKDAVGEIEVAHLSNLSSDEALECGSTVGALIGLGMGGEQGAEAGAIAEAEAAAEGAEVFSDEDAWDVLEEIPNDSAAALILLEHHWAVPLRDAIARTDGFRISDCFISPLDLVEIGLARRGGRRGARTRGRGLTTARRSSPTTHDEKEHRDAAWKKTTGSTPARGDGRRRRLCRAQAPSAPGAGAAGRAAAGRRGSRAGGPGGLGRRYGAADAAQEPAGQRCAHPGGLRRREAEDHRGMMATPARRDWPARAMQRLP